MTSQLNTGLGNAIPRFIRRLCAVLLSIHIASPPVLAAVNSATGNNYHSAVDYSASAGGLRFERSYNSRALTTDVLGAKWRHNWSASLREFTVQSTGATYIEVTRADGQVIFFYGNGAPYDPDTIPRMAIGGGQYIVSDDSSRRETYDSTGKLVSVETAGGQSFTLSYSGSQLLSVTDQFGRSLDFTYDGNGRIATLTDPANQVTSYTYDAAGNLATVAFPNSTSISYGYTNASFPNALTGMTDENGAAHAAWTYDAQGRVASHSLAGGADSTSYTYNADGTTTITEVLGLASTKSFTEIHDVKRTVSTSQPCGACGSATASISYDSNGYVSSRTDFNGNVTTYVHDSRGLETSRTEAAGTSEARTITTTWHPTFRLPTQIDEPGRSTTYTYDGNGNRLSMTVTDTATLESRTTSYSYTAQGLLASMDGPRTSVSDITSFAYDSSGNLTSITNALGHVTQVTSHDAHGNPLTIVDPNGVTTNLTYDLRQRLTSRTVAGATTTFDYDNAGNLIKLTLPTGTYLLYTYDAAHRLTDITDNAGNSIQYTLDAAGNRIKEEVFDPSLVLTRQLEQQYDNQSRLTKILGANGQVTDFGYDAQGNRTSTTEASTFTTSTAYDAMNRVLQVTDAASGITQYGYNALDQLTSVTDANGNPTTYTYNAFGEVTQQVSPDTGITSYTYDPAGNMTSKTDARGITVSYSYDALNRMTFMDYPGTAEDVTYFYDGTNYTAGEPNGIGRLTGYDDEPGLATLIYDARGNVIEDRRTLFNEPYVTAYSYDAADNLASITYPSGRIVSLTRDALGQVTAIDSSKGVNSVAVVSNGSYLPFGPITGFNYGNGGQRTVSFDQDYRITRITATSGAGNTRMDRSYAYDPRNNIASITNHRRGSWSWSYSYDALSRLTQDLRAGITNDYEYDAVGNRTKLTYNGTTVSNYSYAPGSNQLTAINTRPYSHDTAGNRTSRGNVSYSHNAAGRLVEYTQGGTLQYSARYNALGQRVLKDHAGALKADSVFHYDQAGKLIAESDPNGTPIREYVYLNGAPVAQFSYGTQATPGLPGLGLGLGGLLGGGTNLNHHFLITDHLGTPQMAMQSGTNGNITWQADYHAFGHTSSTTGTQANFPLRFPGQYEDDLTPEDGSPVGLQYNYHRDYDPETGRYIQSDPLGLYDGPNTYSYAYQNPLSWTDPLGLAACGDDEDCIEKCLRQYYGSSFDKALALSFFSFASAAAAGFSEYAVTRGSAEANRNLNRGIFAKGTYYDGRRQARSVAQLRRFNAASSVIAAGASGFVTGAYGYCLVNCEVSGE